MWWCCCLCCRLQPFISGQPNKKLATEQVSFHSSSLHLLFLSDTLVLYNPRCPAAPKMHETQSPCRYLLTFTLTHSLRFRVFLCFTVFSLCSVNESIFKGKSSLDIPYSESGWSNQIDGPVLSSLLLLAVLHKKRLFLWSLCEPPGKRVRQ